jgi:hypothetical protein
MPAVIKLSLIFIAPLFRHLNGRMNGTRCVVHKEGNIPQAFPVIQPFYGLIGHALGKMKFRSIGIGFRGFNGRGVFV